MIHQMLCWFASCLVRFPQVVLMWHDIIIYCDKAEKKISTRQPCYVSQNIKLFSVTFYVVIFFLNI